MNIYDIMLLLRNNYWWSTQSTSSFFSTSCACLLAFGTWPSNNYKKFHL